MVADDDYLSRLSIQYSVIENKRGHELLSKIIIRKYRFTGRQPFTRTMGTEAASAESEDT